MASPLTVSMRIRVRGMWRVALLGWAIRLFRLGPAHIEITHDFDEAI
jgi:hypothetical protein